MSKRRADSKLCGIYSYQGTFHVLRKIAVLCLLREAAAAALLCCNAAAFPKQFISRGEAMLATLKAGKLSWTSVQFLHQMHKLCPTLQVYMVWGGGKYKQQYQERNEMHRSTGGDNFLINGDLQYSG